MSRPLRIVLAGGLYHVTSRGNRRETIYWDQVDRLNWLDVLAKVCARHKWRIHAWCQMSNHYHLVVETPDPNLSDGMQMLNGIYTQRTNRRHGSEGHIFQGRFHAVLIERQTHLLEVSRYVVLNPVRAGLVKDPASWRWSSYRTMVGNSIPPPWQATRWLLAQFGPQHATAIRKYASFVQAGVGAPRPSLASSLRCAAGRPDFVEAALSFGCESTMGADLTEVPLANRRPPPPSLPEFDQRFSDRNEAMARAYASGGFSMRAIGMHFGVHRTTVAKAVRLYELRGDREGASTDFTKCK
jgi:REP element-mobilizing transposase RayT